MTFGSERAERKDTGKKVRDKSADACDDCAERKLYLREIFKRFYIGERACKTDCGKRDGIIEKELSGVKDIRILYRLHNAVNHACENALLRAEHESVDHEGKEGSDRDRTALRHFCDTEIGKRKAERDADARICDRLGTRFLFVSFVENKSEHDDERGEKHRRDVKADRLNLIRFQPVVFERGTESVVDADADERDEHEGGAYAKTNDIRPFRGLHENGYRARDEGYRSGKEREENQGLDSVVDKIEDDEKKDDNRRHAECGDRADFIKFRAVFLDDKVEHDKRYEHSERKPYGKGDHCAFGGRKVEDIPRPFFREQGRKKHKNTS